MALIYQNPNGKISGRLGPLYARIVKGRNIFAIMPVPGTRTDIDITTDKYLMFAVAVKFCAALSLYPKLKALNESLRGRFFSGYHALISKNIKLVQPHVPCDANSIVVSGFGFTMSGINVTETACTATVPALNGFLELPADAVNVRFLGAIVYSDPIEPEKDPPFRVTGLQKLVAAFNFISIYNLSVALSDFQKDLASKYRVKTVFLVSVLESATETVLTNSISVSAVLL